jgi:CheY-like chemotaxis protein
MEKKTSPMARPDRFLQKPVKQSLLFDTLMEIFNGHPAPAEAMTDHKPPSVQVLNTRLNILVVEDNGINQKLALEIFKSKGIDPVMAESGAQALELISKQDFHAVFMDIQMPEMNGYQVTRKIRKMEKARDLPVIAMTANAMASDRKKGRLAGMTAYITKPVCPEKLFDTLEACLDIPIRAPEPALPPAEPHRQADMTNQGLAPDLDLPGIDVNQALGRIRGNRDLLFELILEFGTHHGNLVAQIRDLMQKQDKKPLLEEVHKLKGLARNLSANDLGQSIAAFEKAARALPRRFAQDEPHLEALLLKIQNAMQPILETVKMLDRTSTNTSKTASGTKKLPRNILDMTEELKKLISQNSLRAKEVSKQLSDLLCPTPCKEEALCIERHIKRYDFKKADSAFKALETKIRSGLANAC